MAAAAALRRCCAALLSYLVSCIMAAAVRGQGWQLRWGRVRSCAERVRRGGLVTSSLLVPCLVTSSLLPAWHLWTHAQS